MKKITIRIVLIWTVIFVLYGGLRYHTFLNSFAHDEGLFLYGGQAWSAGQLPYRDFWDHKPPGVFFFHSLPLRFFPFSLTAIKLHEIVWLSCSASILFVFCRRRMRPETSVLATLFYIFFTSMPYTIRAGGLTEESALFFVVLCFWLMLRSRGKLRWNCFFAGLALGTAVEFRQTYVFTFVFLIGALLHNAHQRGKKFRDVFRPFLTMCVGLALPEVIISVYFLAHGAWRNYMEASYLFNFYYIGPARHSMPLADVFYKQWMFISKTGPYLFAPLLALSTWKWIPRTTRWMLLPLILAYLGDLIAISLSGEYYEHYYVQASVSTCLLLALFWEGLFTRLQLAWNNGLFRFPSMVFCVYALFLLALVAHFFAGGLRTYIGDYRAICEKRGSPEGEYAFQHGVAEAVQSLTDPEETILLIGRDPNSVYLLAERYAGARFYHFSPLWKDKLSGAVKEIHRQAFLQDVRDKAPVVLLIDLKKRGVIDRFLPEFQAYIDEHYIPLEDLVDEIPTDKWFWYDAWLQFQIRKDKTEMIPTRWKRSL
jgi:hypothetical protein